MKVNNAKGQLTYQIDIEKHGKTGFDFSKDFMTTGKMGVLYPTQAMRVTYGDKVKNDSSVGIQFEPLAVPIMANIFIKQEHYYTPYNCVWQNWDNFISGGEGLMYGEEFKTPPPSFTMKDLFSVVSEMVGYLSLSMCYFNGNSGSNLGGIQGYACCINRNRTLEFLNTFKVQINGIAEQMEVVDIMKVYVIDVIDRMIEMVSNYKYNMVLPELWDEDLIPILLQKYDSSKPLWNLVLSPDYESVSDWKYFYECYTKNIARWQLSKIQNMSPFYPTEFCINFMRELYNCYKPFMGVGSYLDLLGINRLLPADFYYVVMNRILSYINRTIEIGDSNGFITSLDFLLSDDSLGDSMLSEVPMNALNLRALYLIWYNNYRDQLLEVNAFKPINTDELTSQELFVLAMPRHRCWDKDSYTTALDNPATADAVVPLNATAVKTRSQEVVGAGSAEVTRNDKDVYEVVFADNEKFRLPTNFLSTYSPKDTTLSGAKGYFSLSMLDTARRAQKFFRKALYYGNRIQDFIYTNWQVSHLDARLRLPELLATSTAKADINALVNNTTTAESVAGDRAGYASGYDNGNFFERFCEESGVIISMMTVMPQPTYGYGSDRQYACLDRFDYPLPDFATDGMDAVYDTEIMSLPIKVWNLDRLGLSDMPNVFGYQGRYYSDKWRPSTEHGELLTTQDMYTFGRRFNAQDAYGRPLLNYQFVHCFPKLDMFVMADGREDVFRANVNHNTTTDRTLPYHSIYF